jgi:hypothetical protein
MRDGGTSIYVGVPALASAMLAALVVSVLREIPGFLDTDGMLLYGARFRQEVTLDEDEDTICLLASLTAITVISVQILITVISVQILKDRPPRK